LKAVVDLLLKGSQLDLHRVRIRLFENMPLEAHWLVTGSGRFRITKIFLTDVIDGITLSFLDPSQTLVCTEYTFNSQCRQNFQSAQVGPTGLNFSFRVVLRY
jgi:hypothetical protein